MNNRIFYYKKEGQDQEHKKLFSVLNDEIASLQYYLSYFNPDYEIANDTLYGKPDTIPPFGKITNIKENITIGTNTYIVYFAPVLRFHQGVANEEDKSYISFIPSNELKQYLNNKTWKECLSEGIIIPFPPSSVLLSTKWAHHGEQNQNNPELHNPNSYMIVARSSPILYNISLINKNMNFTYSKPYDNKIGLKTIFSFFPYNSRYYLNLNAESSGVYHWKNSVFKDFAAIRDNKIPLITTTEKHIWNGDPSLLHEHYIDYGNGVCEDFIIDDSFQINSTIVDNYNVFSYTIFMKNIDKNKVKFENFISTIII